MRAQVELEIVKGQAHKNHVIEKNKNPVVDLEKAQARPLKEMKGMGQGKTAHPQCQYGQKNTCMSHQVHKIPEKFK